MENLKLNQELEQIISDLEATKLKLGEILGKIEFEIRDIFKSILLAKSLNESEEFFKLLATYQNTIAIIVFKYNYQVSEKLRNFVRDFDRLDDIRLREIMYSRIKSLEYIF